MPQTGDLFPCESGCASLGIDSDAGDAFDISTLAPFNHVHMISGVVHDPQYGQSGVFRFAQATNDFEISVDGGLTFRRVVLAGNPTKGLQLAYDEGNEVILSAGRDIIFHTDDGIFRVSDPDVLNGSLLPVQMSGVIQAVFDATIDDAGGLGFFRHSNVFGNDGYPTSDEEAAARSSGPGKFLYQTGSGITAIQQASGAQYLTNNTAQILPVGVPTTILYDNQRLIDLFYFPDTTTGEVTVLVGGFYRVAYSLNYEKTAGGQASNLQSEILINGVIFPPSVSYAYVRSASFPFGSVYDSVVVELDAGGVVRVDATNLDNATVQTVLDACTVTLEWLRPIDKG